MIKKSERVALGGMFSALCLTLMLATGLVPFATYAMPMLAGAMLIPVVVELGGKAAAGVYVSVSLLSAFILTDKEAALMFIVFFGYYPMLKQKLESLSSRIGEYILKLLLFNAAVSGAVCVVVYVLGMSELLGEFEGFGRYAVPVLLGVGSVMFILYDVALTRYFSLYVNWFKPKFLRR